MEIVIAKIYLIIAGISVVCSIDQPRKPIDRFGAIIGLGVLGFFYYLISH